MKLPSRTALRIICKPRSRCGRIRRRKRWTYVALHSMKRIPLLAIDCIFTVLTGALALMQPWGASAQETAPARDFSKTNAVSVVLGEEEDGSGNGLAHLY